jgi:5-methylcytosine-specific restriction endonuclease McrA
MKFPKPEKRKRKRPKRPARARVRASKGQMRELADDLQSLFVRHRDGWQCWCCRSRKWDEMQAAHLMAKGSYPAQRYNETNLKCLCKRCHRYFTDRPIEWREFLVRKFGEEQVRVMELLARVRHAGHDYRAVAVYYRLKLDMMPDAWKIQDRIDTLTERAVRLGVLPWKGANGKEEAGEA